VNRLRIFDISVPITTFYVTIRYPAQTCMCFVTFIYVLGANHFSVVYKFIAIAANIFLAHH